MGRRGKIAAVAIGALLLPPVGLRLYASYWEREAGAAVIAAAKALAAGTRLSGLRVDGADRSRVSGSLRSGYSIERFDNIGLGFRAYEVFVRAGNGDRLIFDAVHENGSWAVDCCSVRQ